jgi:membrane fusion protein (multidrug efflux system)
MKTDAVGQIVLNESDLIDMIMCDRDLESISEATGAKFALLPPDNSSGNFVKVTQRVPVKIKFNEVEKYKSKLKAGFSVFVSATTN